MKDLKDKSWWSNFSAEEKEAYIAGKRADAANAASVEAYDGFMEICRSLDLISGEELEIYERLPLPAKFAMCAYNALTCPSACEESKEFARQLLQRLV